MGALGRRHRFATDIAEDTFDRFTLTSQIPDQRSDEGAIGAGAVGRDRSRCGGICNKAAIGRVHGRKAVGR